MKTLFPPQEKAKNFFLNRLRGWKNTLDSSQMGTGKTVVGAHIARTLLDEGIVERVAVIAPKAVHPSWNAELEECGIEPLFVLNLERLRLGKTEYVGKVGRSKKVFRWNVPRGTLFLFDEIHKAKGPWTANANLLVSLVSQRHLIHGMSGTPCQDPMDMRSLGYMLGLHNDKQSYASTPSYFGFLRLLKCKQGYWGGYEMEDPEYALEWLHKAMYNVSTNGLTVADFPDSFKENRVVVDPIEFTDSKKINKTYDKLQLTRKQLEDYIDTGKFDAEVMSDDDPIIVKMLRARQQTELYKVKDIVDMATDAVEEGHSVVVFLNFKESLEQAAELLDCDYIDGSVPDDKRQNIIEDFQADKAHVIVVNAATGGTGVSLHDVTGNRPRLSLISPSFNSFEFSQVLGRIHRNGAKTDALQKVMISNGSIEEYVMDALYKKMEQMDTIHRSQTAKLNSSYYKQ
jgi:hypothetical protein